MAVCIVPVCTLAQVFEVEPQFPQPAPGAFTVVGANLPDGRFIVWNGDSVYIQEGVGGGLFGLVATGYAGDPGFVAIAPDGQTALLGAGFSPRLYLLDTNNPADYINGSEISAPTHFTGTFLTQDLVLLDRSNDAFDGTELVIIDISSSKSAPNARMVMAGPRSNGAKDLVVDKPPFSFSSRVALDPTGTVVYAMDSNTRELRSFLAADLINAFNTMTTLDWTTDGTLIGSAGMYFSGGVSGFRPSGDLVIGGSEGFLQPGGIHFVDPMTGMITATFDPAGTQDFYDVIYNQATHEMIARAGSGQAFATVDALAAVPAASVLALGALCALIAVASAMRFVPVRVQPKS